MLFSKKPLVIASLIFCLLSVGIQTTQALTFTEVVNLLQSPDINLPTGVTNPKGNIGFILSNLFWGTADGTKNGKIKPEYLDYSGISAWTQSGTITYLTASTGSVGIGTPNPGEYSTAIRGIDDTATAGALWVSGQTATTPGLMVRNDGNVGIGTASPQAPLQVNGPATSGVQYAMNVIGGAAATWTDGAAIKIGPTTAGQYGSRIVSYSNAPASYGSRLQLQTHDTSATSQSFNTGLLIDENGNIGIGTSSPVDKLHIFSDMTIIGSSSPYMTIETTHPVTASTRYLTKYSAFGLDTILPDGTSGGAEIKITGGDQSVGGGGISLKTDGNNTRMFVRKDGNVGIGTTVPTSKLHVFANPQTTFPMYIGTTDDNNGATKNPYAWNYIPGLLISNDWDGDVATVNSTKVAKIVLNTAAGGYNNGGSIHAEGAGGYNQGQLIFSTGWDSNSLATERMRIGATGNVGIGTASPTSKLHLINAGTSDPSLTHGAAAMVAMAPGSGTELVIGGMAASPYTAWIQHRHQTGDGSSFNLALQPSGGNVGIGTTAPATKLHVVGNIRNSAPSVGYVELSGDLPGYAVNTYPTLKTSGSTLYFSAGGAYSSYISTNGAYTAVSDRNRKENFKILDSQEILDKINRLPMTEWNYKGENSNVRHIGPIAQDFHALFGLNGPNDKMISHIDPSGVALAGIKGLSEQNKVQDAKIKKLEKENNILKSLICLDHKNAEICK